MLYNMFSSDLQTQIFLADNIGAYCDLVHADTTSVTMHFLGKRWSDCKAATLQRENGLNPWAYITATS